MPAMGRVHSPYALMETDFILFFKGERKSYLFIVILGRSMEAVTF